jgi:eukaryotic-like serine/threonine-protein kinase
MISFQSADVPKWRRINALLLEALGLPQDERQQWLEKVTLEHSDVIPQLRALLERVTAETDDFMKRPVSAVWAQAVGDSAVPDAADQVIGPYRLLRELGIGGMATVWLAVRADGVPQRQVAVKLPLNRWARGVGERLKQERDTLAALEHPNIARLYDAGTTADGRPYLAMEFVDGRPIDSFANEQTLSARARVELFLQVLSAVTYAHGRLVVHRDLKPSNILVTRQGSVRLLDFGAAKLLCDEGPQDSALTREVGRALSPDYAAPEQILGEAITVASDVYSLGVVLFELLTGQRPYALKRHTLAALEEAIIAADVPLISAIVSKDRRLCRELRGDLDNIVAKALKKDPTERYGTVAELASDVRCWLDHEPISARRDTVVYRARKFARRNRVGVAAGLLVFISLAVAAGVTTAEMFDARRQRDEARLQAKHAEAEERFTNLVMEQSGPGGRPLTREELLDRSVELLDQQYGDDPRFIANALIPISGRYMDRGMTVKELAVLEKAEAIARRVADPVLLIDVQCNTVETELAMGRLDRAERRMNEAKELLARTPETPLHKRIVCIHADATLADARGDWGAAVERIEAALAMQEQEDRTSSTYRSLLSHAQGLYIHAGRPRDAYATVEKTLGLLKMTDANNNEAASGAFHNQSVALSQMGELRSALSRERESLSLTSGNEDDSVSPVVATVLGRLSTRLNLSAEGEEWTARAVAGARAGGNVGVLTFALAALAEAKAYAGRLDQADAAAQDAVRLLTPTSDPRERMTAHRALTLVALTRRDLAAAEADAAMLLNDLGYPDKRRVRAAQSADVQLLLAARVALDAGRAGYAAQLAHDALEIATSLARNPQQSANVGEARLLLARALLATGDTVGAHTAIQGAAGALRAGLTPEHPLALEASALETKL